MTIRTYILLAYLLIVGGGFYYLLQRNLAELAPRYLESTEESQVDNVNILASIIEGETRGGAPDSARLHALFDDAFRRRFNAAIYSLTKTQVNVRVYATDARGVVIYDSRGQDSAEGLDYSQKHDVHVTLQGGYGARSSREDPENRRALMLYVSAPIRAPDGGAPLGVVAIGKPADSINELVSAARRRMILAGLAGGGLILLLGIAFSMWVTAPITRLTEYARATRDGRSANVPRLARFEGREVRQLREAFEEMRAALEGKTYVESYVQTLTHALKSPLSAIHGAAEILRENPPGEARLRFLGNITTETARIQRIVDQLLQLAALEARKARASMVALDMAAIARETCDAAQPAAQAAGVELVVDAPANAPAPMRGDRALLAQALGNLLQNALEFTPAGGRVTLRVTVSAGEPAPAPDSVGDAPPLWSAVAGGAAATGATALKNAGETADVNRPKRCHRFALSREAPPPRSQMASGGHAAREIIVSVEDNGGGIPDFATERLFEKFYSLARPRSGVKSTGLGLSLVREIARLHGGDAAVANRTDGVQGVRAELRFPRGA